MFHTSSFRIQFRYALHSNALSNFNAMQNWINQIDTFATQHPTHTHTHVSRSVAELAQLRCSIKTQRNVSCGAIALRERNTQTRILHAMIDVKSTSTVLSYGLSVYGIVVMTPRFLPTQNHFAFKFMKCSPTIRQTKLGNIFHNLMFTTFFSYRNAIHSV